MSIAEKMVLDPPVQDEGINPKAIASSAAPEMRSEDGKRVSEALYWSEYYENSDFSYEWNDGVLEEKPVSDYLSFLVYNWFLSLLNHFLDMRPVGKIVGLEFGFRLALPHKMAIRKPDLGILSSRNPVDLDFDDRSFGGIFDLCVEIVSDSKRSELERDTRVKFAEYEQAGVREYYILDRKGTHTAFYRRGSEGIYSPIPPAEGTEQSLIRSDVLPGFQFRIDDLYRRPSPKEMAEDPVYRGFVLPFYQEERKRADRLAAKLNALGFPEE